MKTVLNDFLDGWVLAHGEDNCWDINDKLMLAWTILGILLTAYL
jgi:hypothetical protein